MLLTVQAVPGLSEAAEIQESDNHIPFRFASKEEGLELMLGNTEYYKLNNENKLEFIMQKKDVTEEEYPKEQASNFDEVFGLNTGYVIDPEECMADNFKYAVIYGMDGPEGNGYANPEIIEAIGKYLQRK